MWRPSISRAIEEACSRFAAERPHHFAQLQEGRVDSGIELTLDICRRHELEPVFSPGPKPVDSCSTDLFGSGYAGVGMSLHKLSP